MNAPEELTHFLVWTKFRMACGKAPGQIYASASYWDCVDCTDCLALREQHPGGEREPYESASKP